MDLNKKASMVAFYGHHKCASAWVRDLLGSLTNFLGREMRVFHSPEQFGNNLPEHLKRENIEVLCYTNANYEYIKPIADVKSFHLIRDPRDIVVSAYFSHRNSHPIEDWPDLESHRKLLLESNLSQGLLSEIEFLEGVFSNMKLWNYDLENTKEIKYEDLVRNPYEVMLDCLQHIELVVDAEPTIKNNFKILIGKFNARMSAADRDAWRIRCLDTIPAYHAVQELYFRRFSRLSDGRKRGVEDQQSHYRKGKPGDWRNHFDEKVKDAFKSRYSGLLEKLGYESDANW